jgi:hypothetical protein
MDNIAKYLAWGIFCSVTVLLVSHFFRGLNWQPLVFLWIVCLPLLRAEGVK